jgi:hypothetical protein
MAGGDGSGLRADRQLVAVAMSSIIDDTESIARRMREIEQEEAPAATEGNVFVELAAGLLLDEIAHVYGLRPRGFSEDDESLRARVIKRITSSPGIMGVI